MASNGTREVKIFVSSPGDVMPERQRLQRVVDRLNGRLGGTLKFRLVRWEEGFYKSHDTFQAQIEQASACDIVLSVFWTRLGTELPADFNERLPDGRPYPSGTAYEVLSALEAAREKALPDVYVFRKTQRPLYPDPENEAETQVFESQLKRLRAFWEEWFRNRSGQFRAAFNSFGATDEFEVQAEKLLLEWLANNGGLGRNVRWRIEERGSPFRGLLPFEAENSEVFFGRGVEIERGRERLVDAAGRKAPFLLLLGASGSGKSSLARAGLIPRLTAPGVVEGVDLWRVARLTIGLGNSDPLIGLAAALLEQGALPELTSTPNATPEGIATQLALGGEPAVGLVRWALEAAGEKARKQDGYDRPVAVRLILLVDQFEGHFTGAAKAEQRDAFVAALDALVRSGLVWVIATLRSTEYALLQGNPVLMKLKEDGASLDLTAPDPVALAEAICAPAEAAGLVFERDASSGQGLDQILRADAGGADALPLLQFTLQHLFEAREDRAGTPTLTLDAYRRLGGIEGAIAAEAERAVSGLPELTQGQLPWLLRQLVRTGRRRGDSAVVLSEMTLDEAELAARPGARSLIDALVEARVLVLDAGGETGPRRGRLAHEAVLRSWERARSFVESNARYFHQSEQLQTAMDRWLADSKSRDLLLRGTPLSMAEDLLRTHGEDLSPPTRDFVRNSRRVANRGRNIAYGIAGSMAVLAVCAVAGALYAVQQRSIAVRNFAAAKKTADSLVLDLAQGLRDAEGMRVDLVRKILDRAEEAYKQLAAADEGNAEILRSQAEMQMEFAVTNERQGDTPRQFSSAQAAATTLQLLVAGDPANLDLQRLLSLSYQRLGDVQAVQGNLEVALKSYKDSVAIVEKLSKASPGNADWQTGLLASYDGIGMVLLAQSRLPEALKYFQDNLTIREQLAKKAPDNVGWQRDLSDSYSAIGRVLNDQGKPAEAQKYFMDSLAIREKLAKLEPANSKRQTDVAEAYNGVAINLYSQRRVAEAGKFYRDSLAIRERLAAADPGNVGWQHGLALAFRNLALVVRSEGNSAEALKLDRQNLAIRERLAMSDPDKIRWQTALADSYIQVGFVLQTQSSLAEALKHYQDGTAIYERLAKSYADNPGFQRSLGSSYNVQSALRRVQGNLDEAMKYGRDAFVIREKLATADPENASWQNDLSASHLNIGFILMRQGKFPEAQKAFQEGLAIRDRLSKSDPGNVTRRVALGSSYNDIGIGLAGNSRPEEALKYYRDGLEVRRQLVKMDPGNDGWQEDLAWSYYNVGGLLRLQNNLPEALKHYRDGLEIRERLVKSNPGSATWRRDLGGLYNVIGGVLQAQGDRTQGLKFFRDSLAIREELLKSDPGNVAWQNDLAMSYSSIGGVLQAQGDRAEATKYFRDGLVIRERLATADPANYQKQYDVVVNQWRLAGLGDESLRRLEFVVDKFHKFRDDGRLLPDQVKFMQQAEEQLKKARTR